MPTTDENNYNYGKKLFKTLYVKQNQKFIKYDVKDFIKLDKITK